MKFEIFKFGNVTSTNDMAIKLIKNEKKELGCVYAEVQTNGRGKNGNKWISNKGNLFMSIFFPLKKNYPPFNEFSIINPIIVSDLIKNYCSFKKISFKFPNDVFVNEKKICGILQEVISLNSKKFLIIGIGLNIISNPIIKKNYLTTSIALESNKKPSVLKVVNEMTLSYENFFDKLNNYSFLRFKQRANLIALN